ncbi:MAG: hypothetical protein HRU18_00885 [Pseudoalteromonas sp.]|uniref:hypothetical protein n=1 Tax=Pseudoalteromonas sp. TaxID=53249 RepID=UPI001D5DF102|nr:hypothetical protein [Pseudoalteromonas sp.]NRA76735.1 hypothetical protein [Pseudoalteromonas sp.]
MGLIKDFTLKLTTYDLADKKVKELLAANPSQDYVLTVVEKNERRTLAANRAYQAWIPAISDVLGLTIPEATCHIKLNFGLPILLADDFMGKLIGEGLQANGYFQLGYEEQMKLMLKLPVTRLFDTPMHKRLRDDLQNHFGAMGLQLDYKG